MALIFLGLTPCVICGAKLDTGEDITGFPPFVYNQADPLLPFHDAGAHLACLEKHPFGREAMRRVDELLANTGPGHRICETCNKQIEHPDEYFGIGHLTSDETDPAFRFNYSQFHVSCIRDWSELRYLQDTLDALARSGTWGPNLDWLIAEIKKLIA